MSHLKRLLWLAAWAVWIWLGVGLYRELPRSLGREVSRSPISDVSQSFLGFVAGSDEVAFQLILKDEQKYGILVFNAATGVQSRKIAYSLGANGYKYRNCVRRHGVVFFELPSEPDEGRPGWGLHCLDLRNGQWQFLTGQGVRELVVHPDRPWLAVVERMPTALLLERVAVFDFRTGKRLFTGETTTPQPRGYLNFLPGSDRIVMPNVSEDQQNVAFEVWSLDDPPKKVKTIKGWVIGQSASAGANGRLAFGDHRYPDYVEAFDVDQERVIFSVGSKDFPSPAPQTPRVVLSASGKALLGGSALCVWNVDGGPPIWVASSHETPQAVESNEQVMVVEAWHKLWAEWLPNLKFETRAFRRLDDGELLYRTYADQIPYASHTNAPGTLVVLGNGAVHRMPPQFDWRLLSLCQFILALPLILLWAVLRYRRRRAARRQPAVACVQSVQS